MMTILVLTTVGCYIFVATVNWTVIQQYIRTYLPTTISLLAKDNGRHGGQAPAKVHRCAQSFARCSSITRLLLEENGRDVAICTAPLSITNILRYPRCLKNPASSTHEICFEAFIKQE